jgi:hypothetical protein
VIAMRHSKRRLFHMQQHWSHNFDYAWLNDVRHTTTVLRTLQFTGTRSTDRLGTNYWRALVTSPKFFARSVKLLHLSLRIVSNRSENIIGAGPGKENPSSSIRFSECFYRTFIMGWQLPTLQLPVLKNVLHIKVNKRKRRNCSRV